MCRSSSWALGESSRQRLPDPISVGLFNGPNDARVPEVTSMTSSIIRPGDPDPEDVGPTPGYSYQCYTCDMAIKDSLCTTVTNCTDSTPFCGTAVVEGTFFKWITKFCSAACVNANQNFTYVSATETCCTSDLCNNQKIGDDNSMFDFGSGASGLTINSFLMVVVGLLSYLFAL